MPDANPPTHSDFGRLSEQQNVLDRRHDELRAGIESIKVDAHRRLDAQASAVRANVIAVQGLGKRLEAHEVKLAENTALTTAVKKDTAGLVEAFQAVTGGFKVITWVGKAAAALVKLALPIALIGGAVKGAAMWFSGH